MKSLLTFALMYFVLLGANAQNIYFNETFDDAIADGWTIVPVSGDTAIDNWRFDNPAGREFGQSISGWPYAIFDDAHMLDDVPDTIDLISPPIDMTGKNNSSLFFLEYFEGGFNGKGEIWARGNDGSAEWLKIYETSATSIANPDKIGVDLQPVLKQLDKPSAFRLKFRWIGDGSFWWIVDDIYIYATVSGDAAGVKADNLPQGCVVSFENPLNFTVKNLGTNQVGSLVFNYQLNNDTIVSDSVTFPQNIDQNTLYTHTFLKSPVYQRDLNHIKLWTSGPNGVVDGFPANDTTYLTTYLTKLQVVNIPFSEDFEDSSLNIGFCFSYGASGNGRIYLADSAKGIIPCNGKQSLVMDSKTMGSTIDGLDLLVNLSSCVDKILTFKYGNHNEENDPEDGLFLSVDNGVTFDKIFDFGFGAIGDSITYNVRLNLDSIADSLGIVLTDRSLLRWQHAGNNLVSSGQDGYYLDDIAIDIKNRQVSDALIPQIITPKDEIYKDSAFAIKVYLKNSFEAVDTLVAAKLSFQFGNNPIVTEFWGGCLKPGDSTLFTFSNDINTDSLEQTALLAIWVDMPESKNMIDFNHLNDTISKSIKVACSPVKAIFTNTTGCLGDSTQFAALSPLATSWLWEFQGDSTSSQLQNPKHQFETLDTFVVKLKVADNKGCVDSSESTVVINEKPIASFVAENACLGLPNAFNDFSSNAQYWDWDFGDGAGSSYGQNPTYTYGLPGTYKTLLTVSTEFGCTDTISSYTTVYGLPIANAGKDTTLGCTDTLDLLATATSGTAPYTFYWSNGLDTSFFGNVTPGNYVLYVLDTFQCLGTDTISVALTGSKLQLSVSNDTLVCFGDLATLVAQPDSGILPYKYIWNTGDTTQSIHVQANPLLYSIKVVDSAGCALTKNIHVSQNDEIITDLGEDKTVCFGDSLEIAPTTSGGDGNFTYNWDTGDSIQAIIAHPGNYKVSVTDGTGCSTEDSLQIIENPLLSVNLRSDTIICKSDKINLAANISGGSGIYSIQWNNGSIENAVEVGDGIHQVMVTDDVGCMANAMVTIYPGVSVDLGYNQVLKCGETLSLTPTVTGGDSNYVYLWSTGDTLETVDSLWPGNYSITVTDGLGCTFSDNIMLILFDTDFSLEIPEYHYLCQGDTAYVGPTVTGGTLPYEYNWGDGITDSLIQVAEMGTFYVTVTDSAKCILKDSLKVKISDISIGTQNIGLCFDDSAWIQPVINNGIAPYVYSWGTGDSISTIYVSNEGDYGLTVTDMAGCEATGTFMASQSSPVVNLPEDTMVCGYNPFILTPIITGATLPVNYIWSTGGNADSLAIEETGDYKLEIVDQVGCKSTDSISVQVSMLNVDAQDISVCYTESTLLEPNVSNGIEPYEYLWGTGEKTASITVSNTGEFSLKVTDMAGCIASDTISFLKSMLTVELPEDATICSYSSMTLVPVVTKGVGPFEYKWENGEYSNSLVVKDAGKYKLEVTDNIGCLASDSLNIEVSTITAGFSPTTSLVYLGKDNTVSFTNSSQNATTYTWDFDIGSISTSANPSITFNSTGIFEIVLMASNQHACKDTAYGEVEVRTFTGMDGNYSHEWLNIYPNPASSHILVNIDRIPYNSLEIQIINQLGMVLQKDAIKEFENPIKITLGNYETGIYYLNVIIDGRQFIRPIFIE